MKTFHFLTIPIFTYEEEPIQGKYDIQYHVKKWLLPEFTLCNGEFVSIQVDGNIEIYDDLYQIRFFTGNFLNITSFKEKLLILLHQ